MSENTTSPIIARLAEYVEYAIHLLSVEQDTRISSAKRKLGKIFGKAYIEYADYRDDGTCGVEIIVGDIRMLYSKNDMYYLATCVAWPIKIASMSDLASCVAHYQPTYAQKLLDIRKGK